MPPKPKETVYTTQELTVFALIEPEDTFGDHFWAVPKAHGYVLDMLCTSGVLGRADSQEDIEPGTPLTLNERRGQFVKVHYLFQKSDWYFMWVPASCVTSEKPPRTKYEELKRDLG